MTYDLSNPLHRKQFITRVKALLNKNSRLVELTDGSRRTINQNAYLHCCIRILALETGVSEAYAKDTYFKRMANPDLFIITINDPIIGNKKEALRSSSDLTIEEMSIAITRFRQWAAEQGYYLPEARVNDIGEVEFASEEDLESFRQAKLETDRIEKFL